MPATTGNPPAGASPSAGTLLSPPGEISQPAWFGLDPSGDPILPFYTTAQAARLLGYKAWWLFKQARRHPLYKPTNYPTKSGDYAYYTPEHIYYIKLYLTNKERTDEDEIYRAWMEQRQDELSAALASLRPAPARRGRRAGS
jgi:hypothetical protein